MGKNDDNLRFIYSKSINSIFGLVVIIYCLYLRFILIE